MKHCGSLPDIMVPFAERMFAWFPEVLVALGHPTLQDQFALPPHPGVQMTLEETADHKLVLVKLIRRQRRPIIVAPRGAEEDDSPFSKSRATAVAQAAARHSAAARCTNMEHKHPPQRSQISQPRVVNDAYIPVQLEGTTRMARPTEGNGHQKAMEDNDNGHNLAMRKNTGLQGDPEENQRREEYAKQQQYRRSAAQLTVSAMGESEQQQIRQVLQQQAPPAYSQQTQQQQQTLRQQLQQQRLLPPEMNQLQDSSSQRDRDTNQDSDTPTAPQPDSLERAKTCPANMESPESPKVSAAGGRRMAEKKVMGKGDVDPGSPKFSCPGSHNPWGAKPPEVVVTSAMSTPEPEAAVAAQVTRRMSDTNTSRPPRSEPAMSFTANTFGSFDTPKQLQMERAQTWGGGLPVPPSPPISEGSYGGDKFLPLTPTPKGATAAQPTLASRRNLHGLQNHWLQRGGGKEPKNFTSAGSFTSAEVSPPDVFEESKADKMPIMPGAFSNCRSLFFFDWDDTLCPTTWIREQLKSHLADSIEWSTMSGEQFEMDWRYSIPAWFFHPLPDIPDVRDKILLLQERVIKVIQTAEKYGVVCIVTNAVDGWVESTIKKWLPKLTKYIFGHGSRPSIQVLYGQVEYKKGAHKLPEDLEIKADLGFSELMLWKKVAMSNALQSLDTLYRVAPKSRATDEKSSSSKHSPDNLLNIVSIGDSEFEMVSGELVTLDYQDRDKGRVSRLTGRPQRPLSAPATRELHGRPLFKAVKLQDTPSIDDIVKQLDSLTKSLPQVVSSRSHFRLESEQHENQITFTARRGEWSASGDGADNPDVRVDRLLRTQTI